MGRSKQLLELDGSSLVRRAAEVARAAGCAPIVVVIGAQGDAVRASLAGLPVRVVENAGWQEGIASSIRCGIRALPETALAAILLLCDQPAVSPALLQSMRERQRETGTTIVACRYGDVAGAPVLFLRERFPQLLSLAGDVGARALIAREGGRVATVDFPDGAFDVDSPDDWARWCRRPGPREEPGAV